MPPLCGMAAYFIIKFPGLYRQKEARLFLIGLSILSFVFVCFAYQAYRLGWEARVIKIVRPDGIRIIDEQTHMIKDHGPLAFGGWVPVTTNPIKRIRKVFAIEKQDADRSGTIRLAVLATEGGKITVNNQPYTVQKSNSIQWITIETGISSTGNQAVFDAAISFEGEIYLFQDLQRDYGRTEINSISIDAELVIELLIK